jgi:hypothetical protein
MGKKLPDNERWNTGTLTGAPQIAGLLGELNAVWAFLEHALPKTLARVLNIDNEAAEAVLFALNNTSAKIDIVKAITRRNGGDQRQPILDALATVELLAKRRNRYVHHLMGYDDRGRVCRWDFREPRSTQARRVFVKAQEIEILIVDIRRAYNALTAATFPELGPPPSLGKPGTPPPVPSAGRGQASRSSSKTPKARRQA